MIFHISLKSSFCLFRKIFPKIYLTQNFQKYSLQVSQNPPKVLIEYNIHNFTCNNQLIRNKFTLG